MFFIHLFNTIMNVKVSFLLATLLTAPLLASPVNASPTSSYQINKGTSVRERLAQIRAMMNRGNYTAAKVIYYKGVSPPHYWCLPSTPHVLSNSTWA